MKIAIIDYKAGNTRSVQFALERLGVSAVLTKDPTLLAAADKVIFPGVGEARSAMTYLKKEGLDLAIKNLVQPVLGICLGMQLLCAFSEEGNVEGLNIFPARVKRFIPHPNLKVPHIGWNTLTCNSVPLLAGIPMDSYAYFVHSYYVELGAYTIATCSYGGNFSAALQKDNFYATQFHPEKSNQIGMQILKNFLAL
ncbi:imidazole glycerol phosphate synthase subunit HisH [Aureispira anguillae]|uniref:Imidazole glycerol phosphate synthase subunit HisH n=1 Tax=Aureispira anguillae TaxID=2864201 RepID=A0A915YEV0_9BACT|nr:imidazole glycerol phosphate synthase subunit HisH [Aureispira anguillae]BDS11837.1 imidazole glycerol phosphate synthase subunit HisH [Aureispira anguillae]